MSEVYIQPRPGKGTDGNTILPVGDANPLPVKASSSSDDGQLHRSAITSADKLSAVGTITLSAGAAGGSLTNGTTYYVTASAANRYGNSVPPTPVSAAAGANGTIRAAFAAVTGAENGYDLFLSTDTGPLWVARITEAQRAAGCVVTAVGTVSAGATAGAVDIKVVGTGQASNAGNFAANNAYTPASITPISGAGYSSIKLGIKMSVTDLRSAPGLTLVVAYQPTVANAGGDWFFGYKQVLDFLDDDDAPLEQELTLPLDGEANFVVLISAISGQGAAASIYVTRVR